MSEFDNILKETKFAFARDLSRGLQKKKFPVLTNPVPEDSNWYAFAMDNDLVIEDMDKIAKIAGYHNWYDLDASISPEALDRYPEKKEKIEHALELVKATK